MAARGRITPAVEREIDKGGRVPFASSQATHVAASMGGLSTGPRTAEGRHGLLPPNAAAVGQDSPGNDGNASALAGHSDIQERVKEIKGEAAAKVWVAVGTPASERSSAPSPPSRRHGEAQAPIAAV